MTVFFGTSKPKSVRIFFSSLITELSKITIEGVFDSNGVRFAVKTSCFICDAPTRSFVRGITGHTGYGGCERCIQHGLTLEEQLSRK